MPVKPQPNTDEPSLNKPSKTEYVLRNKRGEWMPDIPLPFYGLKKRCSCGKTFWKERSYRAHYALEHILLGEKSL